MNKKLGLKFIFFVISVVLWLCNSEATGQVNLIEWKVLDAPGISWVKEKFQSPQNFKRLQIGDLVDNLSLM